MHHTHFLLKVFGFYFILFYGYLHINHHDLIPRGGQVLFFLSLSLSLKLQYGGGKEKNIYLSLGGLGEEEEEE